MSSCWSDEPPLCGNAHSFWIAYSYGTTGVML